MKTENKILLKVLVEKRQKKWIKENAKKDKVSEAEFVRAILQAVLEKENE